ncbi:2Fe-2S iron-sulfur cluster-binding protein [Arcobacter sp. FWKO B]|uniref:2Fe-2S iron-sulfur cluster-binding protein n=1 Tax=Arcobacter sp. FWKO B TaxID=2593672 RepID=UPI0018A6096C|nr:2Fe-2S iron-sulfur cluster-binding protein [Arcobacter sp. FWKO B]QOG12200.1 4Fe-4S dicluster domain-containing protein [Arcobacter sp. FWKO B]
MSERVVQFGKELTITIDGKSCNGVYGETILQIARKNGIYIPTMCYLSKVAPISSCRMCVVEVEGNDGFVLSCQEKAVNGANITTNSSELFRHRQNIMKLYDVNHPLQCGVCDKSGECDLQNKTLEFSVSSQQFSAIEQKRRAKKWGILGYDPYLCILCERCVRVCNEVVGSNALYVKPGGYKSEIDIKFSKCQQCGECISVCPVGALVSNGYKYTSNAWEVKKVPASCAHCSSTCSLTYEVKHNGTLQIGEQKIVRVKNDFEFSSLCGAGRFGFDFENKNSSSKEDLEKVIKAIKKCDAIRFDSYITNEEAFILQNLKHKLGIKLYNEDARHFSNFMKNYSSVTGKSLYNGTLSDIKNSDFVIVIGSKVNNDNPMIKFAINQANKTSKAEIIYMHPIADESLKSIYTKYIKYEAGSEEGVMALLANTFVKNKPSEISEYLEDLDIGYISAETNVGEEEIADIACRLNRKKSPVIVVGEDLFAHESVANIAKLVGLFEKYTNFKVVVAPSKTNTLGVSLICDLDIDNKGEFVVGYNSYGDFVISSDGKGDMNIPALNQQEGTFTNINKKVVPTNVAIKFNGFCLNDIANGINNESVKLTVEYTDKLPISKGFKAIKFDLLEDFYDNNGVEHRGYELDIVDVVSEFKFDEIADIQSYDGSVVYSCNPLQQFNEATAITTLCDQEHFLKGSESFAKSAKISSGDEIIININNSTIRKIFRVDSGLKGTIALLPVYDLSKDLDVFKGYRYKKVKIQKVDVQ